MDRWRAIIEPFRIHSVEPIRLTTVEQRDAALEAAGYNLFNLHAADVLIDLLTDLAQARCHATSGPPSSTATRATQARPRGSPSSRRSRSCSRSATSSRPIRAGQPKDPVQRPRPPGSRGPDNTHFDTTRANVEFTGAEAVDLVIPEGRDPSNEHPFKGNMDVEALERLLAERGHDVPVVFVTVTNNSGRRAARLAREPARRARRL